MEKIKVRIDDVKVRLKEYHDFSWLERLGKVFTVYDRQDSGNLLFGVENGGVKRFVKYAGAKTIYYEGNTDEAIQRLREAIQVYRDIKHPTLIGIDDVIETSYGIAAIYKWFDGRGLHNLNEKLEKYTDPRSSYYQYRHMPLAKRLASIKTVFEFLSFVEETGYVVIDLYDGSIMYDFKTDITKICDIDFYRRYPTINDIGENFWGSTRFKAPEEYELNAVIDSTTTVYTFGAMLFHFFGGDTSLTLRELYERGCPLDCSIERWELSKELYAVALKAVSKNRDGRYRNMHEFQKAWEEALQHENINCYRFL